MGGEVLAVKARNRKKNTSQWNEENAVKIKCCYCDANETCVHRLRKEGYEKKGVMTMCVMTPNTKKKKRKKAKSNK